MSTVTPEQQQAAIAKFVSELQAALAPARLNLDGLEGDRNGHFLNGELKKRGWPNTIANVIAVINEVLFLNRLEWQIEPAKLRAVREQQAPIKLKSAQQSNEEFTQKVRAGEKKDADAKEHAALVEQCKSIIEGYNPTKHTRSGSAYDGREREEMQAHWTKELTEAKEKSVEYMRQFTKSLADKRAKRYRDREKALERV